MGERGGEGERGRGGEGGEGERGVGETTEFTDTVYTSLHAGNECFTDGH